MASERIGRLYFDPGDYELVSLVNEFVAGGQRSSQLKKLFNPYLHPRGIKQLAASQEQRIAYCVIHLLDTLEGGTAEDRLVALRSLRDEVLHNSSVTLRRNAARALLEIMKQLVRESGHQRRQLELAHDFFACSSGRPTIIRRELRRYHLLEMPEGWNQVTFDHHVHDAYTKGRKSPTHLITDAWIKGIKDLTVIYYNTVPREVVFELTEAAEIMGVKVRIGIEFSAPFRGRFVHLIWAPRGFSDRQDFLDFLEEEPVKAFADLGREVSHYQQKYVYALLESFNQRHLADFNRTYEISLAQLEPDQLRKFVGPGQASLAHLSELIHGLALPQLAERVANLRARHAHGADPTECQRIAQTVDQLNELLPETIAQRYLSRAANPQLADPKKPVQGSDVPELLRLPPRELIARLRALPAGFRLTLNPSNLTPADVLEIIHDAEGAITHLEIFNLKDYRQGRNPYAAQIAAIRRVLNSGSPIALKRVIQEVAQEVTASAEPDKEERVAKLRHMLRDIPKFIAYYHITRLQSRIGSDSIGRARAFFGMGLAVKNTLYRRARRELEHDMTGRETIPVRTDTSLQVIYRPRESHVGWINRLYEFLRQVPGVQSLGYEREERWHLEENTTRTDTRGNIVTLGGLEEHPDNGFSLKSNGVQAQRRPGWRYLNSTLKNVIKVLIGFIPAFLTFRLRDNWWLLANFGAVIWFAITGLRNVVQSVIGGRGLFKSSQLRWNDLVSWERVTDSLLFTGFSVPLLDWLVKGVILDDGLGINTSTSPALLYTVIALVNGTYLVAHNRFRGLPRGAQIGNFFRSVLSIPLAIVFHGLLIELLKLNGMSAQAASEALQKWATLIAKAASDTVAGLIEGTADRAANLRTRRADYKVKMAQVLDIHGRLEVLLPDANVLDMLESPKQLLRTIEKEARDLETQLIANSLDLMYFWTYQPRAPLAFRQLLAGAQPEERQIILRSQRVLERERAISEMFLDNLVGKRFSRALAFYLDKWPNYLAAMKRLDEHEASSRPGAMTGAITGIVIQARDDERSEDTGTFRQVRRD